MKFRKVSQQSLEHQAKVDALAALPEADNDQPDPVEEHLWGHRGVGKDSAELQWKFIA